MLEAGTEADLLPAQRRLPSKTADPELPIGPEGRSGRLGTINVSAVSDAPQNERRLCEAAKGRIRYSRLKEAACPQAIMQIQ